MGLIKRKTNKDGAGILFGTSEGSSIIEVVVAALAVALIASPIFVSILASVRMNSRAEVISAAECAITNAVESMNADGIDTSDTAIWTETDEFVYITHSFADVMVIAELDEDTFFFRVKVVYVGDETLFAETIVRNGE
ncbi:MAG: hypothetical protein LUG88_03580 [Clostridia bacterium]|nr:hypothetical protein [Clostridia bacterium]